MCIINSGRKHLPETFVANLANQPRKRNPLAGIKRPQTAGDAAARAALAKRMREAFVVEPSGRPPGDKLLFWLGEAALRLREEAGLGPSAVAAKLGKREGTVEAFEKGVNMPRNLEAMLAAYAEVVGLNDSRDIIRDALRLWYEYGEAPTLTSPAEGEGAQAREESTPQPDPVGRPPTPPGQDERESGEGG